MDNPIPTPEWTRQVARAATAPEPKDRFLDSLRTQIERRIETRRTARMKFRRVAWSVSLGIAFFLGACLLIVGPANVAAALREALGYIPGFGVVHTTGLRVLAEPAAETRDGVTVTVQTVVADSEQTIVSYKITGLNLRGLENGEPPVPESCFSQSSLRLPDGKRLEANGGGGVVLEDSYEGRDHFPPLPDDVEQADLVFSCLPMTLPGTAPENWEVPFRLVHNPAAPTVFPVLPVDAPSPEGAEPSASSPADTFRQQISLAIDSIVEVDDGYILMGTLQTRSEEYIIKSILPPDAVKMTDAAGTEIPLEEVPVGDAFIAQPFDPTTPARWAYKVLGKSFRGPLTLSVEYVGVALENPPMLIVEVGSLPYNGQRWTLDRPIDWIGAPAIVESAEYVVRDDLGSERMQGLEFTVRLPEEIEGLQLNYWNPDANGGAFTSLSDGLRRGANTIRIGFLTTLPLSGEVTVVANVMYLRGPWTAVWDPPTSR
jgi:hypothetical protein